MPCPATVRPGLSPKLLSPLGAGLPLLLLFLLLAASACAPLARPPLAPSLEPHAPLATASASAAAHSERAALLLRDGPDLDPQAALELLSTELLAQNPAPRARLLALTALRLLGRCQEAVAAANRLILSGQLAADAFAERGLCLASLERHERALEDFEAALRLDPGNLTALLAQGDLHFAQERPAQAEASYARAIAAAPGQPLAWINRGVARDEQGRHQEAIADYDQALRLDPGSGTALANRGVARSQLGDVPGMCADYARACALGACRRFDDARAMGYCLQQP